MNKIDFKKLLDNHDWWWMMSDSAAVRDRGYEAEEKIKSLMAGKAGLEEMYNKKKEEIYNPKKPDHGKRVNRRNGKKPDKP